jgi:hypothetical protein
MWAPLALKVGSKAWPIGPDAPVTKILAMRRFTMLEHFSRRARLKP